MVDNPGSPTPFIIAIGGLVVVVFLVLGGIYLVHTMRANAVSDHLVMLNAERLAMEKVRLSRELAISRSEVEQLHRDAKRESRVAVDAASAPSQVSQPERVRDAVTLRAAIASAISSGDGRQLIALLGELAALGDEHLPNVVAEWVELANMDGAALDRLGLSRIDLASALVQSKNLMKFALDEADLDPTFRQFTARTLEQAATELRRAILDDFDFSTEKDKSVLHPLVRATKGIQDESYVDRFSTLVQRTDLYNDSRSSIAFRIAAIGGDKGRKAIDLMRVNSGGKGLFKRMLPVLESIYAPPATGLLVTNGSRPASDRIGHNDLILEYGGQKIRTRADLTRADAKTKLNQVVAVKIIRDGTEHILSITVTDTAPGHLHFSSLPIVRR